MLCVEVCWSKHVCKAEIWPAHWSYMQKQVMGAETERPFTLLQSTAPPTWFRGCEFERNKSHTVALSDFPSSFLGVLMWYICMFTNNFTIWQKNVLVISVFETPDNFLLAKNNLEMYQLWKQSTVEVLQLFEQYYDAKESLWLLLQWRLSFNSNIATGTCVVYMFSYKRKKQPSLSWPVLKRKLSPALTYISLLRTNTLHRPAWINRLGVKISRTLAAALCLPYVWVCGPTQVWK